MTGLFSDWMYGFLTGSATVALCVIAAILVVMIKAEAAAKDDAEFTGGEF